MKNTTLGRLVSPLLEGAGEVAAGGHGPDVEHFLDRRFVQRFLRRTLSMDATAIEDGDPAHVDITEDVIRSLLDKINPTEIPAPPAP